MALFLDIVLMVLYIKKSNSPKEEFAVYESGKTEVSQKIDDTRTNTMQKNTVPEEIKATNDINPLFVGDSRTVGVSVVVKDIDVLAKNGSKYDYLVSLDEKIKKAKNDCIVIGFGVNDPENIEKYIEYANDLSDSIDSSVYFLTVNPTQGEHEKTNEKIEKFNSLLKENSGKYTVIDTNSYLKDTGFNTTDGIHYDDDTYVLIYNYIISSIKNIEAKHD